MTYCDFAANSGKIERDMLHKESGTTCFTKGFCVEMGGLSPSGLARCRAFTQKPRHPRSFSETGWGGVARLHKCLVCQKICCQDILHRGVLRQRLMVVSFATQRALWGCEK